MKKAPRLVEKSLGELHIMGRKKWRVQKMGYTKMNRHNYPDIEGLTEAERAKLDHIDDIEDDLADAYDSTATYAVGDWCIRNGKLYECITAIATAEPFDSTKWRRVAVAELKSNLTNLETYSTDEIVIGDFLGKPLYRKVYNLGSDLLVNAQTWTNTNISNSNIYFIERVTCYTSGGTCMGFFCANRDTQSYVQLLQTRTTAVNVRYIVLEYTKVTD